jgi:hypothetical protein
MKEMHRFHKLLSDTPVIVPNHFLRRTKEKILSQIILICFRQWEFHLKIEALSPHQTDNLR